MKPSISNTVQCTPKSTCKLNASGYSSCMVQVWNHWKTPHLDDLALGTWEERETAEQARDQVVHLEVLNSLPPLARMESIHSRVQCYPTPTFLAQPDKAQIWTTTYHCHDSLDTWILYKVSLDIQPTLQTCTYSQKVYCLDFSLDIIL